MEELVAAYVDAMSTPLTTPEERAAHEARIREHFQLAGQDLVLLAPAERERALQKTDEPAQKPTTATWLEKLRAQRAAEAPAREARYRKAARPYAKKYGLDVVADKAQIQELITAAKRLEQCANCQGICQHIGDHEFETVKISAEGKVRWWLPCPVEIRRRIEEKLPAKYADKTFDDYEVTDDNRKAVGLANWFLEHGNGRGLYLSGGVGTGKTFLAALIAKNFIERGDWVVFGTMPTLLNQLKETFDNPQLSSQMVLRKFINCDLLVLDDVGVGKLSAWNLDVLFQILNGRYESKKVTVLTSNYSLEELARKIAEVDSLGAARIQSRLAGTSYFTSLGDRDRRRGQ